MTDELNATSLHEGVRILDVVLRSSSATTTLNPRVLPETFPRLELAYETSVERHDDILVAEVRLSVVGTTEGEEEGEVLRLEGTYAAVYHCNPARDTTPEDLQEFGDLSALFNVWPFWRELVSSYYMRMNLPLPILPSLAPNIGLVLGGEVTESEA